MTGLTELEQLKFNYNLVCAQLTDANLDRQHLKLHIGRLQQAAQEVIDRWDQLEGGDDGWSRGKLNTAIESLTDAYDPPEVEP